MPAPSFILALQLLSCAGFVRTLSAAGVVDAEPITLRKARPFAVIVFGFIGTLYSNITALKVSPMPGCPMPHQRLYYQSHKIKCCCLHPRRSQVHVTVAHFAPVQAPPCLPSAAWTLCRDHAAVPPALNLTLPGCRRLSTSPWTPSSASAPRCR